MEINYRPKEDRTIKEVDYLVALEKSLLLLLEEYTLYETLNLNTTCKNVQCDFSQYEIYDFSHVHNERTRIGIVLDAVNHYCNGNCKREMTFRNSFRQSVNNHHYLIFSCPSCKYRITYSLFSEREKLKLTGKYPIKEISIPKYVNKEVGKYLSESIIAGYGGFIMSGICTLRVFIEQHVRFITSLNSCDNIEELFQEYRKCFIDKIHLENTNAKGAVYDSLPSLKNIYDSLSSAIHRGDQNVDLYYSSLSKLSGHFKGIELYTPEWKDGHTNNEN